MQRIHFLNTKIDNLTMVEALQEIDGLISEGFCRYIVTPNLDHIVMLERDAAFAEAYQNADLILADGKPLLWISNWLRNPIREKISGSDLFPRMCEMAAQKGYKVFLLGAEKGVADKAAENLKKKYAGLHVVGTYAPTFGFETDPEEMAHIQSMIIAAKPDILGVALGSPKAEKFIYTHLQDFQVPLSISIGATLDFESGNARRAPKWMSNMGFEWLFRIMQDPKRMTKRYVRDAVYILPIIHKYKYQKYENTDRLDLTGR